MKKEIRLLNSHFLNSLPERIKLKNLGSTVSVRLAVRAPVWGGGQTGVPHHLCSHIQWEGWGGGPEGCKGLQNGLESEELEPQSS